MKLAISKYKHGQILVVGVVFAVVSIALLIVSLAATGNVLVEGEKTSSAVTKISDSSASGNSYVQFGAGSVAGADEHLRLILNQSTRNKKFIANMPSIGGTTFWKNGYDETVVPEEQLNVDDFIGPSSEHYGGGGQSRQGQFRTECEFSHFAYDDPIVAPNQPGKAHLHMFFGNTHANAYTNDQTIRATGSGSCNGGPLNRTSYWIPAMLDQNGKARTPERIVVYYKSLATSPRDKAELYPKGLKIISGNANANAEQTKSLPNAYTLVGYDGCGHDSDNGEGPKTGLMPKNCGSSGKFRVVVRFPFCWDGKNLDSSDHNSHMAFPQRNGKDDWFAPNCPDSHPHMMPTIEYRIQFEFFPQDDVSKWFLASDVRRDGNGGYTMAPGGNGSTLHGDWYSGWNLDINQRWIDGCNNVNGDCGFGKLSFNGPDGLKRLRTNSDPNSGLGFYDDPIMEPSELIKLCPGKKLTADIKSVALCN